MRRKIWFLSSLLAFSLVASVALVSAQETTPQGEDGLLASLSPAFTYQGQLKQDGSSINGKCDFEFRLFDAGTGGEPVGSTLTKTNVGLNEGLFTVQLDFGASAFPGSARWLEVAPRCPAGSGSFITLSPRQPLTAAPYALALPGLWTQQNVTSPNLIGGFWGNSVTSGVVGAAIGGGGAVDNTNRVTDDYGTIGGGASNQAGDNAGTTSDHTYATIGGGYSNTASAILSTVSGGWENRASATGAAVGGGAFNTASDEYTIIGGGYNNTSSDYASTVSGGYQNSASSRFSAIGGGIANNASEELSTVGGGFSNTASGYAATVGGGSNNLAAAAYATIAGGGPADPEDPGNSSNRVTDDYGTVGGGGQNRAGNDDGDALNARYATVSGGYWNTASGYGATVGGGYLNTASGYSATVSGGYENAASGSQATVGGGSYNTASHIGATVGGGVDNTASGDWATVGGGVDNTASHIGATVGGGIGNTASGHIATVGGGYLNTASGQYATVPGGLNNIAQGAFSFAAGRRAQAYNQGCFVLADSNDADEPCVNDNRFVFRVTNGFYIWTTANHTAGVLLPAGGSAWSSLSDRAAKENFAALDERDILERLASIPIQTWNYKSQDPAIRHIGPVAQDFYAAFQVGEDDTHISTIDADGVALAAIQGLYSLVQEQTARIEGLEAENAVLQERLDSLDARLAALEKGKDPLNASQPLSQSLPGLALFLLGLGLFAVVQQRAGNKKYN